MGHFVRLQLIAKVSYYVGWIALACGGLLHLNLVRALFAALTVNKRNLFELSVVSFLICMASELRVLATANQEAPGVAKGQLAA